MKITSALILFLLIFGIGNAEGNTNKYPELLNLAVEEVISAMSEENKQTVKNTSKYELIQYHHGLGTSIRNGLGLWRGNDKLIVDACGKPCHPDDASGVIIYAVWCKLNGVGYSKEDYLEIQKKKFEILLEKMKNSNKTKQ